MTQLEKFILKTFRYDPETGVMIRVLRNYVRAKDYPIYKTAGTIDRNGYRRIVFRTFGGEKSGMAAHRIAFLFMQGKLPPDGIDVDHINGIKGDNRWINLRLATRSQNNMNSKIKRKFTLTGQKGVNINKECWSAQIAVNKKIIKLGKFEKFEDAVKAREKAEIKYLGHLCLDNKSNNTSGRKGVFHHPEAIFSRITVDGKIIHLGMFKTVDEATKVRKQAEVKYFGEFAKI